MITFFLILLNVAVFFLELVAGKYFVPLFDLQPSLMFLQPWRIITSMFLHASFFHLFFNMWALSIFGPLVERRIGSKKFLILYFISGTAGAFLYWLSYVLGIIGDVPAVGASGAIYGVLAAATVFFPNAIVFIWFFPMRMRDAFWLWLVLEFFGSFNPNSMIASAAHLGGLLAGYVYANKIREEEMFEWWWV